MWGGVILKKIACMQEKLEGVKNFGSMGVLGRGTWGDGWGIVGLVGMRYVGGWNERVG